MVSLQLPFVCAIHSARCPASRLALAIACHLIKLCLLLRWVQAKAGEHLRVVGSPAALGSWEVSKAPRLSQEAGAQQLWSGTVELPLAQSFEFKFAVVPDAAGE